MANEKKKPEQADNVVERRGAAVKKLKDYLDALEKARSLEKLARSRLQIDNLSLSEQGKWSGILREVSLTIGSIEDSLSEDVLIEIRQLCAKKTAGEDN